MAAAQEMTESETATSIVMVIQQVTYHIWIPMTPVLHTLRLKTLRMPGEFFPWLESLACPPAGRVHVALGQGTACHCSLEISIHKYSSLCSFCPGRMQTYQQCKSTH